MGINPVSIVKTAASTFSGNVVSCTVKAAVSSERSPSVNLFRFFKKGLHKYDEISGILSKLSQEERLVGCLPDTWCKLFKPSDLREKTFQAHSIFTSFARKLNETSRAKPPNSALERLSETLKEFLGKKNEVEFVGSGMFGSVVKIKSGKENFALKVFHCAPENAEPFSMQAYSRHGQTMEIQNAIALNHALKPSQRARFYLGNATSIGDDDGYMLLEFVEQAKKSNELRPYLPTEDFEYKKFVFGDILTRGNIIDGKLVDFGDISYRFANKTQENIAKKLFPLICKGKLKELAALRAQYRGNADFEAVVQKSCAEIVNFLKDPFNLSSFIKDKGAKEVLSAMNTLGIDFPALKTYKRFKNGEVEFLKSVGIIA